MLIPHPFRGKRPSRLPVFVPALVLVLALQFATSACARTSPEPPTPAALQLAGDYHGSLTVEGNPFPASMTIHQDGADLVILLSVPDLGAVARGTGVAHDDRFAATVPYEINCPGEASFEGRVEDDDGELTGSLTARDCEGTRSGTFQFSRHGL